MTTIKSFTSLEQSNVLSEILPLESADMHYARIMDDLEAFEWTPLLSPIPKVCATYVENVPCWSLAALLSYLREIDFFPQIEVDEHNVTMDISYYNEEEARPLAPVHNIKVKANTLVDACYEMLLKLHEEEML